MAEHHAALAALRIVPAGHVAAGRERGAVRFGAGEDVVPIRLVAEAVHDVALLGQRRLLADVVLAMELVEIVRDDLALRVSPRSLADPIARVDGVRSLRAEIGVPGVVTRADRARELLAMAIGARKAAVVGAFPRPGARDEKRHLRGGAACATRHLHPAHVAAARDKRAEGRQSDRQSCHSFSPLYGAGDNRRQSPVNIDRDDAIPAAPRARYRHDAAGTLADEQDIFRKPRRMT